MSNRPSLVSPLQCTTQSVAIGYEDGSVSLISITGEKCYEYSIHDSPVLFICSNSKQLASLDCSNRIFVWSTEERYECVELEVNLLANCSILSFNFVSDLFHNPHHFYTAATAIRPLVFELVWELRLKRFQSIQNGH